MKCDKCGGRGGAFWPSSSPITSRQMYGIDPIWLTCQHCRGAGIELSPALDGDEETGAMLAWAGSGVEEAYLVTGADDG